MAWTVDEKSGTWHRDGGGCIVVVGRGQYAASYWLEEYQCNVRRRCSTLEIAQGWVEGVADAVEQIKECEDELTMKARAILG